MLSAIYNDNVIVELPGSNDTLEAKMRTCKPCGYFMASLSFLFLCACGPDGTVLQDYSPGPSSDELSGWVFADQPMDSGSGPITIGAELGKLCGQSIFYNGPNAQECLGETCSLSSNGPFGYFRQCTEFAARFACSISLNCTHKDGCYGNANEWFDGKTPDGKITCHTPSNILSQIPPERRFRSGSTAELPRSGDIITFNIPASTGHVAIVEKVDSTNGLIFTNDQNIGAHYRVQRKLSVDKNGIASVDNAIGWMRPSVDLPTCFVSIAPIVPITVDYFPYVSFDAGGFGTGYVAVADMDRDMKIDVLTANLDGSVSVILGNGNGTFIAPKNFPVLPGSRAIHIATGDFNSDGFVDVVTVNELGSSVSVLMGSPGGALGAPRSYPVGVEPWYVAVGDLNLDAKPDLVVANRNNNNISILINNGDGTFKNQQVFTTGNVPVSVVIGDLNGDMRPDVIVTNLYDTNISVLLGNGDGTLRAQNRFSVGINPNQASLADFNNDGKLDAIVSNSSSDTMSLLIGNGDGSFQSQISLSPGIRADWGLAADLNLDNKQDIVFAGANGKAGIMLGNGDGTFQPARGFSIGTVSSGLALGKLNGDMVPDIVVATNGITKVAVLLSK